MRKLISITVCCLFLLVPSQAKEWRGINPLHSTRKDARKILGKPDLIYSNKHVERYRITDGFVFIEYAFDRCDLIGDNWGTFDVPQWTVVLIRTEFVEHPIPVGTIGVPNLQGLEKQPTSSGDIHYYDRSQGVAYTVRDADVIGMDYGPSAADNHLRCERKKLAQPNKSLDRSGGCAFCIIIGPAKVE